MTFKRKNEAAIISGSSLLRSILLSGGLLICAIIALTLWTLREDWHGAVRQTEEMAVNLSLSQSRQAEDTVLQTELALREVQRDLQAQPLEKLNAANLSQIMRDLQSRLPQLHGLFYYDEQGRWIATSTRSVPVGTNNSDREYFRYHRNNSRDSLHIGPVIRSRSTGDLVIPVSLRVSDAARDFKGILLATIKVDYFRRFYSYYELGPRDVLVLMLADSTVLYARPMPDSYIGKSLSASHLFQQMLVKADRGSGEWNAALDGQVRIFGFASSERYPLVVAAGYDKRNLYLRWVKGRLQDISLNVALLVAIILLGLFVIRQARHSQHYQEALLKLKNDLADANHHLDLLAFFDGLTGLANRRQFDRFLQNALHNLREKSEPVSLILMDIDYFKHYNDRYGHVAGDHCLRQVADALKRLKLRQSDMVARYGGEEFAIILAGADQHAALNIARQAVQAIADLHLPHAASALPDAQVTLSAGCATTWHDDQAGNLIEHADAALYQAKHSGRNQAQAWRAVSD